MLTNRLQKTMFSWLRPSCKLCDLPLESHSTQSLCGACLDWYAPTTRCARCGLPCETPTEQCGQCLTSPPPWHKLYCLGDYRFPLNQSVHQLKYQRQFWQARPLAGLLAPRIVSPAPLVTCVPLHWRRHAWRGFNQSDVLARQLAQQLGSQYQPRLFSRRLATPPQQGLNKAQRRRNLNQAFVLNSAPNHRHIAIVDDVVTTGSTVRQLCNLLLDVGVESLDIYCICRTPEPGD
nr:phosphoribosyltransferase family protein [Vibrio fluvialis]